ncbi:dihydropteroate synthase, partial [Listeria monocytogenes]|nr:dihydropteroate synthase [Listeria monocytogenes]
MWFTPFFHTGFLMPKNEKKNWKSHETLTKVTAYPPKTWLIYSH